MKEETIIAIYCICDDFIQSIKHQDAHNVQLTTAEVLLTVLIAMRFFYGNLEHSRKFLLSHRYISKKFSKSCLNKRVHQIPETWWHEMLRYIQDKKGQEGLSPDYIADSFPVSVCRNIRIQRCRVYQGEEFRGYNAGKR